MKAWLHRPALWVLPFLVLGLAAQEAGVRLGFIPQVMIAAPTAILGKMPMLVAEEELLERIGLTFGLTFAAAALAILAGVPVGWALHRFRLLNRAYESWFVGLGAAPLILLYPLFLVMFGRNLFTITLMGFMVAVIPVVLKTREGMDGVRPVLIAVGKSFKLSGLRLFWKVQFPAAVPVIFTGIRLGLIVSLINIVALEFLVNIGGLGRLINDLAERFETAAMYGAIGFVVAISVTFFVLTERIELWLRPK
ncbi:MAG: ABC transporter permease subunit [Rhodospirillales bacterium]|nr:ABC transporter permease subunit [Rhodospirillales bacterium]